MGKLDAQVMRHLSKDDYRVLTAVELGMRNHHAVPVPLIVSIAGLRHGGAAKFLSTLLRFKLVYHDNTVYEGYRLTWFGYDVLALRALANRGAVDSVGRKIGEGKESDVYEGVRASDGRRVIIKLHRLGKTSFKAVKNMRDYLDGRRSAGNWLNMSRLAARREWDFMSCLWADGGLAVPEPLDQNRHAVVMGLAEGLPLYQLGAPGCLADAEAVLETCVGLARALAARGLVHCDLNEFNLIVEPNASKVTLIDFPQMVSAEHPNAATYYRRDVTGLLKFFTMKLKYEIAEEDVDKLLDFASARASEPGAVRLDAATRASGHDGVAPDRRRGRGGRRKADVAAAAEEGAFEDSGDSDDEEEGSDAEGDVEALRAEFLARARLDAPADDAAAGDAAAEDDAPPDAAAPPAPRESFFDDADAADAAVRPAPRADVCARKLRREQGKATERRARHNGGGKSRNFTKKVTAHGQKKHREKLVAEY